MVRDVSWLQLSHWGDDVTQLTQQIPEMLEAYTTEQIDCGTACRAVTDMLSSTFKVSLKENVSHGLALFATM